jgi:hypothetical protein
MIAGANRRDYVLPNYAVDGGFWQFMRAHYDAHYVVAEVKNLSGSPGKREILQVANYLNPHGTGLFALVLARMELDTTATWICREQWVQHNSKYSEVLWVAHPRTPLTCMFEGALHAIPEYLRTTSSSSESTTMT